MSKRNPRANCHMLTGGRWSSGELQGVFRSALLLSTALWALCCALPGTARGAAQYSVHIQQVDPAKNPIHTPDELACDGDSNELQFRIYVETKSTAAVPYAIYSGIGEKRQSKETLANIVREVTTPVFLSENMQIRNLTLDPKSKQQLLILLVPAKGSEEHFSFPLRNISPNRKRGTTHYTDRYAADRSAALKAKTQPSQQITATPSPSPSPLPSPSPSPAAGQLPPSSPAAAPITLTHNDIWRYNHDDGQTFTIALRNSTQQSLKTNFTFDPPGIIALATPAPDGFYVPMGNSEVRLKLTEDGERAVQRGETFKPVTVTLAGAETGGWNTASQFRLEPDSGWELPEIGLAIGLLALAFIGAVGSLVACWSLAKKIKTLRHQMGRLTRDASPSTPRGAALHRTEEALLKAGVVTLRGDQVIVNSSWVLSAANQAADELAKLVSTTPTFEAALRSSATLAAAEHNKAFDALTQLRKGLEQTGQTQVIDLQQVTRNVDQLAMSLRQETQNRCYQTAWIITVLGAVFAAERLRRKIREEERFIARLFEKFGTDYATVISGTLSSDQQAKARELLGRIPAMERATSKFFEKEVSDIDPARFLPEHGAAHLFDHPDECNSIDSWSQFITAEPQRFREYARQAVMEASATEGSDGLGSADPELRQRFLSTIFCELCDLLWDAGLTLHPAQRQWITDILGDLKSRFDIAWIWPYIKNELVNRDKHHIMGQRPSKYPMGTVLQVDRLGIVDGTRVVRKAMVWSSAGGARPAHAGGGDHAASERSVRRTKTDQTPQPDEFAR